MINLKVRLKNPIFVFELLSAIVITILAYLNVAPSDITTWNILWDVIYQTLSNPNLLMIIALLIMNAVNDPTTRGLTDSKNALTYHKPQ